MIKDGEVKTGDLAGKAVTVDKINPGANGQILTTNSNGAAAWAAPGITDVTSGGGLARVGSGTAASPYTVGIADGGVTSANIAAGAVDLAKLAPSVEGEYRWLLWDGTKWAVQNYAGVVVSVGAGEMNVSDRVGLSTIAASDELLSAPSSLCRAEYYATGYLMRCVYSRGAPYFMCHATASSSITKITWERLHFVCL
jgi:hypothetical protein